MKTLGKLIWNISEFTGIGLGSYAPIVFGWMVGVRGVSVESESVDNQYISYEDFMGLLESFRLAVSNYQSGGIFYSIQLEEIEKTFYPIVASTFPECDGLSNKNPFSIKLWLFNNQSLIDNRLKRTVL